MRECIGFCGLLAEEDDVFCEGCREGFEYTNDISDWPEWADLGGEG